MGRTTVGRGRRRISSAERRPTASDDHTSSVGVPSHRRRTLIHRVGVTMVAATIMALGLVAVTEQPSTSAPSTSPVSVAVTATPSQAAPNQAVAYRIVMTNNGSSTATGVTLTDAFTGVGLGQMTQPAVQTASGTCTYTSPTETCTTPTLAAGQVWTVTLTMAVSVPVSSAYSDTATVTGSEGTAFSTSATASSTSSSGLAAGFTQTKLAGGLAKPIVLQFAPNGDLYVGLQAGKIVIFRNGAVLPTPVLSLTVFQQGETGLLGMALDPNFATNGYLYVSYTAALTTSVGPNQPYARLSRFTVVNSVANPASEKILYTGNQVQLEDGTGGNYDHAGNDLKIGPDGKLWWSVGDNVPSISNGENLTNIYGKILRFNLDGTVPSDNPFVNVAGAVPYIYAYGLRNPWRFTFLPTGQAMTEDTGSNYWEDLDTIQAGGNYGWPFKEGDCGSCGYLNPAFDYGHYPTDGAASAIAAYSGSTFPAAYDHVVFFGDYNRTDIEAVSFDPTYNTQTATRSSTATPGPSLISSRGPTATSTS